LFTFVANYGNAVSSALTLHFDVETGFGCIDDDFVVKAKREAEAVETGAEIGA